MKWALLLVAGVLLFLPATANAQVTGAPIFQEWSVQSLVPGPSHAITVVEDASRVYATPKDGVIHFYPRGPSESDSDYGARLSTGSYGRPLYMHEVGHIYDQWNMTPRKRQIFRKIMGIPPHEKWWGTWASPGEQFAMAYSFAAIGQTQANNYWWGYRYTPTKHQQERVVHLLTH